MRTRDDHRLGVVLDSILVAFLIWLSLNPIVTMLSPKLTLSIQAAMLSHRDVGCAFLVFLALYYPAHVLAANRLSLKSIAKILSPVRGPLIIGFSFVVLMRARTLNRVYGPVLVLGLALAAFEWFQRGRGLRRRLFDVLATLLLFLLAVTSAAEAGVRILLIVAAGYGIARLVRLTLDYLRDPKNAPDPFGKSALYLACVMALVAIVLSGGTICGRFSTFLPRMEVLHALTSMGLLATILLHVRVVRRAWNAEGQTRRLLSIPVISLTGIALLTWEGCRATEFSRYAPSILPASGAQAVMASRLSRLRGFPLPVADGWFEAPTKRCGNDDCHREVVEQHQLSAHGRAFVNEAFQWQLAQFIREKGRTAADYCLSCHAPLGVIRYPGDGVRGEIIDPITTSDPAFVLGVGCVVCHRAVPDKVREKLGNGSIEIRPLWLEEEKYLGEDVPGGEGLQQLLTSTAGALHKRTFGLKAEDWDYVCAACHRLDLPGELSVDGKDRHGVFDQYTSFVDSPFAKQDLTCSSCHQQRFVAYDRGYYMIDHHYLGSGSSLPYADGGGDKELREISVGFLSGLGDIVLPANSKKDLPPCIEDISEYKKRYVLLRERVPGRSYAGTNGGLSSRSLLGMDLDVASAGDGVVRISVKTRNECIGHTFPSGGGLKAYLEVVALGEAGSVIVRASGADESGVPKGEAMTLGSRVEDIHGEPIRDRRFWDAYRVAYERYLKPGEVIADEVSLRIPQDGKPKSIEATWYYIRPEAFRNKERGVDRNVPPVIVGRVTRDSPQ